MIFISFLGVLLLSITHLFTTRLNLSQIPRSRWLSFAGGVSVTYIFLEALPHLREMQEKVHERGKFSLDLYEGSTVFLVALFGLIAFYGLENWASKSTRSDRPPQEGREKKFEGIFWIHLGAFAVYNFVIGYLLLVRERESVESLLLYCVAMAFHFMVNDHGMEDHFQEEYRRKGRWVLVAAVFLGWLVSLLWFIPEGVMGLIFAFVAGGIIMNVMKEELPRERESNFLAFLTGTAIYGLFLGII